VTPCPKAPSRRAALAAGIGVAAGATLLAPGPSRPAEKPSGGDEDVSATEDLMREHGVLRRILVVYREVAGRLGRGDVAFEAQALADAARLFTQFGEDYHERRLEEAHIFPAVRKAGGDAAGLIDPLLAQHERGRRVTQFILAVCASPKVASGDAGRLAVALDGFARMYEAHAAYEDTIVFQAWRRTMSKAQLAAAGDLFEDIERETFHGDGFDIAVERIAAIERRLGLHDLARFTAPAAPTGPARAP
jgi:hemerythrin-like domain-containing protein